MPRGKTLKCAKCKSTKFKINREATYLYTYKINGSITEKWSKNTETLPFLFDSREKIKDKQSLQCENCNEVYPYDLGDDIKIHFSILQKAIVSENTTNPEF